jgi:hypothetical protein
MAGEVVIGDQVYVIPLADGTGSWVLTTDEYGDLAVCQIPQSPTTSEVVVEPTAAAPAAVSAGGVVLMLLAGLL